LSNRQDGRPEGYCPVDLTGAPHDDAADVHPSAPVARSTTRSGFRTAPKATGQTATAAPDTDEPWTGPLTDPLCRDTGFAGRDVAALAAAGDWWTVPPTHVASADLRTWAARRTARRVLPERARAAMRLDGPVSVRGWLATDGVSPPVGPVWYNLDPGSVQEAVIELIALAIRDHASDGSARLVVACQQFLAPDVSVNVVVDRSAERVELFACRGLDEDLGAGVWRDVLVLAGSRLDTERHDVVHKPTATVPADGGTRIDAVEPRLRGRPAVPVRTGRMIARLARRSAERLGADLRLELALRGEDVYLLACSLNG
jgi:hypothetical protein